MAVFCLVLLFRERPALLTMGRKWSSPGYSEHQRTSSCDGESSRFCGRSRTRADVVRHLSLVATTVIVNVAQQGSKTKALPATVAVARLGRVFCCTQRALLSHFLHLLSQDSVPR